MKIAIIGSGLIGGTLTRLLVKAGYEVALTNSRGPASLKNFVDELGEKVHPLALEQTLNFGDIIIVSIHWRTLESLPVFKAEGKIVVDTTNPYKDDGTIYNLGGDISSNKVVKIFPGAKIVKAFNTIWYKHLAENGNNSFPMEDRKVIPVASDDINAKQTISKLIEAIGFGPLDTGTLKQGSKLQEPEGALYAKDITVKEAKLFVK